VEHFGAVSAAAERRQDDDDDDHERPENRNQPNHHGKYVRIHCRLLVLEIPKKITWVRGGGLCLVTAYS